MFRKLPSIVEFGQLFVSACRKTDQGRVGRRRRCPGAAGAQASEGKSDGVMFASPAPAAVLEAQCQRTIESAVTLGAAAQSGEEIPVGAKALIERCAPAAMPLRCSAKVARAAVGPGVESVSASRLTVDLLG